MALMIIMFYGGFGTNWSMAKPVAKDDYFELFRVVATALITGLFCCIS